MTGSGLRPSVIIGVIRKELLALDFRLSFCLELARFVPSLAANRVRTAILRLGGLSIGSGTAFGGPIKVEGFFGARGLRVGRDCIVNGGCHFDVTERIEIGDRVALGQDVLILTGSHDVGPPELRWGRMTEARVWVGSGTWVGARSLIMPGVTIGEGAVVAAGAVVTADVAPNTLVAGVPAKTLKHLEPPAPSAG
jgi:maltose O-acetyltransferase